MIARRSAVALVATLAAACSGGGGDDTLQPIPIQGGTAAPSPTALVTAPSATTTTIAAPMTTTVAGSVPGSVGDWDGARFDVGTISALTNVGALDAISFDRWSYTSRDGTRDAPHLTAEPVVAWWRTSPFTNVQVRNRTFVLAPDVEVLVLDPAGRAAACAEPPPAKPPKPSWDRAGVAALSDPANTGTVATLAYSDTGQVTRIRLTRGC